jgi:hypothetical protein
MNPKRFAQWTLNTKAVQLWLLPVWFTFLTLRFDSLFGLFGYIPEPIKRGRSSPENHNRDCHHQL